MAELINKNIINVIKKATSNHPRQWHTLLKYVLWADRTRVKAALKTSPFLLFYRKEPMLPMMLNLPTYQFMHDYMIEDDMKDA